MDNMTELHNKVDKLVVTDIDTEYSRLARQLVLNELQQTNLEVDYAEQRKALLNTQEALQDKLENIKKFKADYTSDLDLDSKSSYDYSLLDTVADSEFFINPEGKVTISKYNVTFNDKTASKPMMLVEESTLTPFRVFPSGGSLSSFVGLSQSTISNNMRNLKAFKVVFDNHVYQCYSVPFLEVFDEKEDTYVMSPEKLNFYLGKPQAEAYMNNNPQTTEWVIE